MEIKIDLLVIFLLIEKKKAKQKGQAVSELGNKDSQTMTKLFRYKCHLSIRLILIVDVFQ